MIGVRSGQGKSCFVNTSASRLLFSKNSDQNLYESQVVSMLSFRWAQKQTYVHVGDMESTTVKHLAHLLRCAVQRIIQVPKESRAFPIMA